MQKMSHHQKSPENKPKATFIVEISFANINNNKNYFDLILSQIASYFKEN